MSERNRIAAFLAATQFHPCDVHAVVAEDRADGADDTGNVFVL
jgi:hypothetical protein